MYKAAFQKEAAFFMLIFLLSGNYRIIVIFPIASSGNIFDW
jgi:hypothetical protein